MLNNYMRFLVLLLLPTMAMADQLSFEFGNPAFSKQGYSSHVLSVEQLSYSRKQDVIDDAKSEAARAQRDAENTTVAKFIKNVESRIYANLSKQLVDNMFGICDPGLTECTTTDSGVATVEGAEISWVRDSTTGTITLNIISEDGTTTTISVPIDGFGF